MLPPLILPASVLITTIDVCGSCLVDDKCMAAVVVPPVDLVVAISLKDAEVVVLGVLCVEDNDFAWWARPEIKRNREFCKNR